MPDEFFQPTGYGYAGTMGAVPIQTPWVQWTTTTATTMPIPSNTWGLWQSHPTTLQTTGAISSNVWGLWQQPSVVNGIGVTNVGITAGAGLPRLVDPGAPFPETKAQFEARVAGERRRARQTLVRQQRERAGALRRRIAERKAEALLREHLTVEQEREWSEGRAFHVVTAGGLRTYRIAYGLAGNVRLVKSEGEDPVGKHGRRIKVGARFCAHVYHPDGRVPNQDNVLAQKLLIEAAEEQFLAMANVS